MHDTKRYIYSEKELQQKIKNESFYRRNAVFEYVAIANEMAYDSDKTKRLEEQYCIYDWYLKGTRIAMQAFWTVNCQICNSEMIFPNSNTNKICLDCAIRHDICRRCM